MLSTFYDYRRKATFSKHIPLDEAQTVEVAGVQDLPQRKLWETAVVVTILHTHILIVLYLHRFYCYATCSPFSIHLVFCELSWTELARRLLIYHPTFYKKKAVEFEVCTQRTLSSRQVVLKKRCLGNGKNHRIKEMRNNYVFTKITLEMFTHFAYKCHQS